VPAALVLGRPRNGSVFHIGEFVNRRKNPCGVLHLLASARLRAFSA